MELFRIDHDIVVEKIDGETRPFIKLGLVDETLKKKEIFLSYSQLKYLIFHLELAKEETQTTLGTTMNKYIH